MSGVIGLDAKMIREKWNESEIVTLDDKQIKDVVRRMFECLDLIIEARKTREWKRQDELVKKIEDIIGVPVVFGETYFWPALVIPVDDSDTIAVFEVVPEKYIKIDRVRNNAISITNTTGVSVKVSELSWYEMILVEVFEDDRKGRYIETYMYQGTEINISYPDKHMTPPFDLIRKVVGSEHLVLQAIEGPHIYDAVDALEEKLGMPVYLESDLVGENKDLPIPHVLIKDWSYRYYRNYSKDTIYIHGITLAKIATQQIEIVIDKPPEYSCREDPDYRGCCTEVCVYVNLIPFTAILTNLDRNFRSVIEIRRALIEGDQEKVKRLVEELERSLGIPVLLGKNPGKYPALVINTDTSDDRVVAWLQLRNTMSIKLGMSSY